MKFSRAPRCPHCHRRQRGYDREVASGIDPHLALYHHRCLALRVLGSDTKIISHVVELCTKAVTERTRGRATSLSS